MKLVGIKVIFYVVQIIFSFSLICKLFEKPACNQLEKYLFHYNLYARRQSAYRVGHST